MSNQQQQGMGGPQMQALPTYTYVMEDHDGLFAAIKWIGDFPQQVMAGLVTLYNASTGQFIKSAPNRNGTHLHQMNLPGATQIRSVDPHGVSILEGFEAINGFRTDKQPTTQAAWPFPTGNAPQTVNRKVTADISYGQFVVDNGDGTVSPAQVSPLADPLDLSGLDLTYKCSAYEQERGRVEGRPEYCRPYYVGPLKDAVCSACQGDVWHTDTNHGQKCSHCRTEEESIRKLEQGGSSEGIAAVSELYRQNRLMRARARNLNVSFPPKSRP